MEHPPKHEWMIWGYPRDLGNLRLTGNRYGDSNLIYLHRRQERPIFCLLDGKTLHIPFIGFLQTMYTPQGARITWTLDFGSLNIGDHLNIYRFTWTWVSGSLEHRTLWRHGHHSHL